MAQTDDAEQTTDDAARDGLPKNEQGAAADGDGSNLEKPTDEWVTGDEPATAAQLSYLETLARENDRELPDDLTKAQASDLIDELQSGSPRVQEG